MNGGSKMFMISDQCVNDLGELLYTAVEEVTFKAYEYIESHPKPYSVIGYPERDSYFFESSDCNEEYREQIPIARYGISKYKEGRLPEEKYDFCEIFFSPYLALVNIQIGKAPYSDYVKIKESKSFCEIVKYLAEHRDIVEILVHGVEKGKLEDRLESIIRSIVERYLFENQAIHGMPENYETKLKFLIIEKLQLLFSKELHVMICVPVSLATFAQEEMELSDAVRIKRIPEEIQKSRQMECRYELTNESWVAAAATHMIVIDGYHYENGKDLDISFSTHAPECYPVDTVDEIVGIIRIVTGRDIGYEQILALPLCWYDSFRADLPIVYGARVQSVNPREYKKTWMQLEITEITPEQICKIQGLYRSLEGLQQNAKAEKGKEVGEAKRFLFALKRFNRCKLRNEEDDMATDATIGLEALLLGGDKKGEITYKLSSRIPVVFQFIKNENFTSANSRRLMGKIYNYRSSVVHGSELRERDRIEVINGKEFEIPDLAVEFLRYTLQFMLEHPEYLDAKKFDEYMDNAVQNME